MTYSEEERLDYLMGQVHGLKATLMATNASIPSTVLVSAIGKARQAVLPNTEAVALSEAYLDGVHEITDALQQHAERLLEP